jgi:uncharacterized protein with PIN domain
MKNFEHAACPTCDRTLEQFDTTSIEVPDGDTISMEIIGVCPQCKDYYIFEEIFTYTRFKNLKKLK